MGAPYRITLFGPLDVLDAEGVSIRPRRKKACGLISLLACAPSFSRSRDWLKAHLWSDSDDVHASNCLRQEIWKLRNKQYIEEPFVIADQNYVSLDQSKIVIVPVGENSPLEFLEGLDIRDEAFEEWLRHQRARHWTDIMNDAGSALKAS